MSKLVQGGRPRVSVVIPLFEKGATIRRALDSVFAQTVSDYEVIVVDDGSTDSGPAIVRGCSDPRVRIVSQANRGVAAARNAGIVLATADLVALLDADDAWEPDFLDTILRMRAEHPRAGVYGTSYWWRLPSGSRPAVLKGVPAGFSTGILRNYFFVAAQSDPPVFSSAVALDKRAIEDIGGFPVGVSAGEDLLTWARLAARYDVAYCATPKAGFWAPVVVADRPGRVPQIPDVVGAALARLLDERSAERTTGLARYLSLWHRMRAVVFLQLGDARRARAELRRSMSYALSTRACALYLLAFAPSEVSARALGALRAARRALSA